MSDVWFYADDEKLYGPHTEEQLRFSAQRGMIKPDYLVRKGQDGPWHPARDYKGLLPPPAGPKQKTEEEVRQENAERARKEAEVAQQKEEAKQRQIKEMEEKKRQYELEIQRQREAAEQAQKVQLEEYERAKRLDKEIAIEEGGERKSYPALAFFSKLYQIVGALCILGAVICLIMALKALDQNARNEALHQIGLGPLFAAILVCAFWAVVCFSTAEFLIWLCDMKTGNTATNLLLQQLIEKIEQSHTTGKHRSSTDR